MFHQGYRRRRKRRAPRGIELRTSRTRSENHTTRPQSLWKYAQSQGLRASQSAHDYRIKMNTKKKKNFVCAHCNKSFIDNAHLKDHEVRSPLRR